MITRDLKLIVTLLRTEGLLEVFKRLAFRFFHVHTFAVYRLRLTDALPAGQIPPGIELKEVGTEQLNALRRGRSDLPEYFFRDEIDNAAMRCWVGLDKGRLGFIAWISDRGSSDLIRIGEKEAELAYIYCLKEMRGKHLTINALYVIMRTLWNEGVTSILAVPHSENPAINKSFQACGFVKIGAIRRYAFFTWPRTPVDYSRVADPAPRREDARVG